MKNTTKIQTMVNLQLTANLQFEVLGYVKPELMNQINDLAKDFDIYEHLTVMAILRGHYDEVGIMIHNN